MGLSMGHCGIIHQGFASIEGGGCVLLGAAFSVSHISKPEPHTEESISYISANLPNSIAYISLLLKFLPTFITNLKTQRVKTRLQKLSLNKVYKKMLHQIIQKQSYHSLTHFETIIWYATHSTWAR